MSPRGHLSRRTKRKKSKLQVSPARVRPQGCPVASHLGLLRPLWLWGSSSSVLRPQLASWPPPRPPTADKTRHRGKRSLRVGASVRLLPSGARTLKTRVSFRGGRGNRRTASLI